MMTAEEQEKLKQAYEDACLETSENFAKWQASRQRQQELQHKMTFLPQSALTSKEEAIAHQNNLMAYLEHSKKLRIDANEHAEQLKRKLIEFIDGGPSDGRKN